jgi:hypothetical protein
MNSNNIALTNYSNTIAATSFNIKIFYKLFIYIGLAIIAIYFAPEYVKTLFLLITLFLFFISKPSNDYFWIILTLIFIDNPGNIFWKTTDIILQIGILKFSYLEFFSIVALFKTLAKKSYPKLSSFLKKPYNIYIFWLLFLLIEGIIIGIEGGGSTGHRYLWYYYRLIVILPLFYTLPRILAYRDNIYKFCHLIFILVFINFGLQLVSLFLRQNLHLLLGGSIPTYWDTGVFYSEAEMIRPIFGVYINLFSFFSASYFYASKNKNFNSTYLLLIIITCFVSILITATRGWILAYSFFLIAILLFFMKQRNFASTVFKILIIIIPLFLLFITSPVIKSQLSGSFERLSTLEALVRGDPTLEGTNVRLTDRHIPVMSKFYERPLTGWGFSGVGMDTADGHVGNQSTLMIGGVIGYIIIVYIWFYILFNIRMVGRAGNTNICSSLKILSLSLLTLVIIHSTSSQIFGYFLYAKGEGGAFTLSIYLSMISTFLHNAKIKIQKIK